MFAPQKTILANLTSFYDADANMPTRDQWAHLFDLPAEAPIAAVNYVKLRDQAIYTSEKQEPARSGLEAMMLYSAVSIPRAAAVGGSFLLSGLHQGAVIGPTTDWDLIIIGQFPTPEAYLSLFVDQEYQAAFYHRRAAVEVWHSVLSTGAAA